MTTRRSMLAIVTFVTLLALPTAEALAQQISGTWESRVSDSRDRGRDRVHLSMEVDRGSSRDWQHGSSYELDELEGVTREQLEADRGAVRFEIDREAGTIFFEGDVRNGRGFGEFRFEPDADYRRAMADLGYPGLDSERQYSFAIFDVTTDVVRELRQLGYDDLSEDKLTTFAIHGVRPEFIREMNALGYRDIDPDQLVTLRIHGVTPDWVRSIRAALGR